jgi:hypothetical protein
MVLHVEYFSQVDQIFKSECQTFLLLPAGAFQAHREAKNKVASVLEYCPTEVPGGSGDTGILNLGISSGITIILPLPFL